MSYQKIYTYLYYVANEEVPSTFSQIVEQIEVIQEVDKKQGDQTKFSPKRTLEKAKWI